MNLKQILLVLTALLFHSWDSSAQSPTYNFTTSRDTAIESNATVIAGYVKSSTSPTASDSVLIVLTSGPPRSSHMNPAASYVIHFTPGVDSASFAIILHDDTFPQRPEHVVYSLYPYSSTDTIGPNNTFTFVLLDNDLPATISYVADTDSVYLHDVNVLLCETVNNPNPFNIRYRTRIYDFWSGIGLTAYPGFSYNYYADTIYAPPGISTVCQTLQLVPNPGPTDYTTLLASLVNVDDNIIVDSFMFIKIWNDNIYYPPAVFFDVSGITVVKDTSVRVGVPITTITSNYRPISFTIDTIQFTSTSPFLNAPFQHFSLNNNYFSHGIGTWHDTLWINIFDTHLIFDTSVAILKIKGINLNTSADTLFALTIIDTGSLVISFKGAGFAHLKGDSVGYVQVYTSAPTKYPITADVRYLNGDAVMGVDFLWHDTTVTFAANAFDTVSLPVIMLKNHIHDGNKQVNLRLSNAGPGDISYDIIQYSFMIIDNDSTASFPAGISGPNDMNAINVYPNPFGSEINIHTEMESYDMAITNLMGEKIENTSVHSGNMRINLSHVPAGAYLIRISNSEKSYVKMVTKMQ